MYSMLLNNSTHTPESPHVHLQYHTNYEYCTLPPILGPTLLLNPPILRKRLLQTLPLILHVIQQLRKLMSSRPNCPHRRNLFHQGPARLIHGILCVDFARVIIHDIDSAVFPVATLENVCGEGIEFGGGYGGGSACRGSGGGECGALRGNGMGVWEDGLGY